MREPVERRKERKFATALFADRVGPPRYMGDAVLAVFGVLHAHEDRT